MFSATIQQVAPPTCTVDMVDQTWATSVYDSNSNIDFNNSFLNIIHVLILDNNGNITTSNAGTIANVALTATNEEKGYIATSNLLITFSGQSEDYVFQYDNNGNIEPQNH